MKYLYSDKDRWGTERHYYRRHGRKIRLRIAPGEKGFEAEFAAAAELATRRSGRSHTGGSWVYFIRYGRRVKIGVSKNVPKRLGRFRTGIPGVATIRYMTPGDRSLEQKLHRLFDEHRVNGEWFTYSPEIREWIKTDERKRAVGQIPNFT